MAVLQRVRLISNERLDLPDALNLDAFGNADWSAFVDNFFTGAGSPLVISGFDIPSPDTYVTKKVATVLINIANSMMFHPESVGGAGGFFVANGSEPQQSIALTPNQTNFIEIDQASATGASDTRAIWDEAGGVDGTGEEFATTIDTVTNLTVVASVNTVGFTAGKVPLAKVVVDVNGVVTSITDCRNLMFRLGTGGTSPDPTFRFSWPDGRTDHDVTLTSADPTDNPFTGSDKAITNFKSWANAVMSRLAEIQGPGAKWFEGSTAGSGSLTNLFMDAVGSILTSKSGTGEFQWNGAGNTLTWTTDLEVRSVCGPYFFTIKATSATLNAGDVAYVSQVRNLPFPLADNALSWTNGATFVDGFAGSFAGLESDTTSAASRGDWIKKSIDGIHRYVRILNFYNAPGGIAGGGAITTAALAQSVELVSAYGGTTDATSHGVYSKGAYTVTAGPAANVAFSADVWWLASRWGTPTAQLYTRDGFLMQDGEHRIVGYALTDKILADVLDAENGRTYVTIGNGSTNFGDFNGTTLAVFTSAMAALPSGGTIFVKPGTYTFATKLSIATAGLRILGESPERVILTGAIAGDAVVELAAARTELLGISVTQTSNTANTSAVTIANAASFGKVMDCIISNLAEPGAGVFYGLRLKQSSDNQVLRNRFKVHSAASALCYAVGLDETITVGTVKVQGNEFLDNYFTPDNSGASSIVYFYFRVIANGGAVVVSLDHNTIVGNAETTIATTPASATFIDLTATKTAGTSALIQNNVIGGNTQLTTSSSFLIGVASGAGAAVSNHVLGGNATQSPTDGANGFECTDGGLKIDGASTSWSNPVATDPVTNEVRAKNTVKAWGLYTTDGLGAVTLSDGFNVASVAVSGTEVEVTFAASMGDAKYAVVFGQEDSGTAFVPSLITATKTTAHFFLRLRNSGSNAIINQAAVGVLISFSVIGIQ